jgi:hypothetical protein
LKALQIPGRKGKNQSAKNENKFAEYEIKHANYEK